MGRCLLLCCVTALLLSCSSGRSTLVLPCDDPRYVELSERSDELTYDERRILDILDKRCKEYMARQAEYRDADPMSSGTASSAFWVIGGLLALALGSVLLLRLLFRSG